MLICGELPVFGLVVFFFFFFFFPMPQFGIRDWALVLK